MNPSIADITALGGGMTQEQVRTWARSKGYRQSTRATHIMISPGDQQRLVLNPIRIRLEVRTASGEWTRIGSAPYRELSISQDGKILGLRRNW